MIMIKRIMGSEDADCQSNESEAEGISRTLERRKGKESYKKKKQVKRKRQVKFKEKKKEKKEKPISMFLILPQYMKMWKNALFVED
ncbi:hypothetical protein Tco_1318577 [Tanacetum coccineum]